MPAIRTLPSAAPALLAALLLAACGGAPGAPADAPPGAVASRVGTAELARDVAGRAAAAAGYRLGDYVVRSVERVGPGETSFAGMWRVQYEHVPPAPPGGHFTVYVDPAGRTQLFHGE